MPLPDFEIQCLHTDEAGSKEQAIFLGIRPSKIDGDDDYGHLWLVLAPEVGYCGGTYCFHHADTVPMRQRAQDWIGYYPDLPDLPPVITQAPSEGRTRAFLNFFRDTDVPGVKLVDHMARLLATRYPEKVKWVGVFGSNAELRSAVERARISEGELERVGRYGLDTSHAGVNNCVSWAVDAVVNPVLPKDKVFEVGNPPTIRSFLTSDDNRKCRTVMPES